MRRPFRYTPHSLFVLVLALAFAVALATQFPQAEILERAQSWPLVGPSVARFRVAYLPAVRGAETPDERVASSSPAPEVDVVRVIDPDFVGPKPKVWARPGTAIRAEPDFGGAEIGRVEHLFPLSRLERRGDWFRVRFGTRLSGFSKGWVYLPDYRDPTPEELNAPAPVLPLAPVPIAAEARAAALRLLGAAASEGSCGPFALLTDVRSPEILAMCDLVGAKIESAHRRRYGLDLVGEAAETIVLLAQVPTYRAFRDSIGRGISGDAFASPARGFVAVPVGGQPSRARSSLIHELTHLLNRRALGPALPSWLDEGIARDLETVGLELPFGPALSTGGRVASLEDLFDLDPAVFQMRSHEHYRAAGRWMGYLVAGPDPELAAGTREFLQAVALGEPIQAELLLDHLGRDWSELEAGFRAWESADPQLASD